MGPKRSEDNDDDIKLILKSLKETEKKMMDSLDSKYKSLLTSIMENKDAIEAAATNAYEAKQLADSNRAAINELQMKVAKLETTNGGLEKVLEAQCQQMDKQVIQIHVLQTRLEDQTCRNSRTSVLIRGIPEENPGKESWDQTRELVCKKFSEHYGLTKQEVDEMIERVHRGKPSRNENKHGGRIIHAKFYDWNDCEKVKKLAIKYSKRSGIFVDQRYGPNTTWRRDRAMIARKELKDAGSIVAGYVAYPAKLFVKRKDDEKYVMHDDYSKLDVPLELGL